MTRSERPSRFTVILAFALVYVFWGSTYMAIRVAVGDVGTGSHIPPALMAGLRFIIAGPLMLAYCALTGRSIRLSGREAVRISLIGILLLTISNVVLSWAEQWVPSGLAALLVSGTPIWFLILETWVLPSEHRVSSRALAGIALGVVGIIVLIWPELRHTSGLGSRELLASVVLPISSLSWATGSLLSKKWKMRVDPFSSTGWQMTFAGIANLAIAGVVGDVPLAEWSLKGFGAIIYLVIFGSWVGFTAYIWLLNHVPTPKVATYAYVNPVVAVFLGWLVLKEQITGYILAGTIVVVGAVALVTGAELKKRAAVAGEPVLPAVESTGD